VEVPVEVAVPVAVVSPSVRLSAPASTHVAVDVRVIVLVLPSTRASAPASCWNPPVDVVPPVDVAPSPTVAPASAVVPPETIAPPVPACPPVDVVPPAATVPPVAASPPVPIAPPVVDKVAGSDVGDESHARGTSATRRNRMARLLPIAGHRFVTVVGILAARSIALAVFMRLLSFALRIVVLRDRHGSAAARLSRSTCLDQPACTRIIIAVTFASPRRSSGLTGKLARATDLKTASDRNSRETRQR